MRRLTLVFREKPKGLSSFATVLADPRPSRSASERKLHRTYWVRPSGSPPVSGSTNAIRSASIAGSFFLYPRATGPRHSNPSLWAALKLGSQVISAASDGFMVKPTDSGDPSDTSVAEGF